MAGLLDALRRRRTRPPRGFPAAGLDLYDDPKGAAV